MRRNQIGQIRVGLEALIVVLLICSLPCRVLASDINENQGTDAFLAYGSVGDAVLELQTRLMELQYFHDELQFTPTVYDDRTQAAVECFCAYNGVSYAGTGVNAALQRLIYAQGAIPYSEPTEDLTVKQKFSAYMSKEILIFGKSAPMFVGWICGATLTILILFLVVYFFVPEKSRSRTAETELSPPQYWRKSASTIAGATVMTQEKVHGLTSQKLEFQIQYHGKNRMASCSYPPVITIGRKDCTVMLDSRDKLVSGNHCEIYLRGAIWMMKDHSTNGTRLNGRLLHNAECRINGGDEIVIGAHKLNIQQLQ